jgi:septum formation protein
VLILASISPRRRELVSLLGLPFQSISAAADETPRGNESPADLVRRLSRAKVEAGVHDFPDAVVVAADTIVALDDLILGKPRDRDDATRMLRLLRGRSHTVYSGLTVAHGAEVVQVATTTVWLRDYSDADIAAHVATGDPLDKAAAYAIQYHSFHPVARIEGCHANVMGLPLCHLYRALKELAIPLREPDRACQEHLNIFCPVARQSLSG